MTESTFISKEDLIKGPDQRPNADFVDRVKNDEDIAFDSLNLSFYFITNSKRKIDRLAKYINSEMPNYDVLEVIENEELWELQGRSPKILIEIETINNWEKKLWDTGLQFDCKLDGWETMYE